jgi:hypothetical protein
MRWCCHWWRNYSIWTVVMMAGTARLLLEAWAGTDNSDKAP